MTGDAPKRRFTWVPELRTKEGDPWAHRKGEPRGFTLVWAAYLIVSAWLTIFAVRTIGPGRPSVAQQFDAGLQFALALLGGACVMWPMLRLSQHRPRRIGSGLFIDWLILIVPIYGALLFTPNLAGWPLMVAVQLACLCASWSMLVGVVIAAGLRSSNVVDRAGAMVWVVLLVGGAATLERAVAGVFGAPMLPACVSGAISPIVGTLVLTDRAGLCQQPWLVAGAVPAGLALVGMLVLVFLPDRANASDSPGSPAAEEPKAHAVEEPIDSA